MSTETTKTGRRRLWWLLGAAALLGAAILFVILVDPPARDADAAADRRIRRSVTVVEAAAGIYAAELVVFAEVRPRWSSMLRAQVDGELVRVSDDFQPGARVAAGRVLAVVDSTAWRANLAEADIRLAMAELALLRAEEEAEEARRSWRDAGLDGPPDSRLVLHEPQLAAARGERDAARASRDWAARQLDRTRIRAPFDGVITARDISRGESVLTGETLGGIFATGAFEIEVGLSPEQWAVLPDTPTGLPVAVRAQQGPGSWTGRVIRQGAAIEPSTQMRSLTLEVTDPLASQPPLLPGAFVEVHLPGRDTPGLLEIPEGALTPRGQVWYVDDADRLARFDAETVFSRAGRLYVEAPAENAVWRIVRYPLTSYLVGQDVHPVVEREGA